MLLCEYVICIYVFLHTHTLRERMKVTQTQANARDMFVLCVLYTNGRSMLHG